MLTGTTGGGDAERAAFLAKRIEEVAGMRSAIAEEIQEETRTYALKDLRNELRRVEDVLRELRVKQFELQGKIKRPVAARQVKCPTCQRYIPAGTILTPELRAALESVNK